MPTHHRRDAKGRRARSRGPQILRFEPLEGRQLLAAAFEAAAAGAKSPDLAAVALGTDSYGDWGTALGVHGTFENRGDADVTSPFKVELYVSASPDRSTGAVKFGTLEFDGLKAGEQASFDRDFDLPPSAVAGVGGDGAIYVGMIVDAEGTVAESVESNNLDTGRGVDSSLVLIVPKQPANLEVGSVQFGRTALQWGETVAVKARITNTLGGQAPASTARVVLTPPGFAVGAGQDVTLVGDLEVPELLPYQSVDVAGTVTLPPGPHRDDPSAGGYIARLIADADDTVNPTLAPQAPRGRGIDWDVLAIAPDPAAPALDPAAPLPDLAAADVLTPGVTLNWGQPFQVAATIQNRGLANSGPVAVRFLLGGPNGESNNALVLGTTTLPDGIAAGGSTAINQTLKLPGKLPFGDALGEGLGRILVQVDPENQIDEADESANVAASSPMTLALPTPVAPHLPGATVPPPATPTTPTTPTPTTPTPTTASREQRLLAYRSRIEAFRAQLTQRRDAMAARQRSIAAVGRRILSMNTTDA